MVNTVTVEDKGVPAISVIHKDFINDARSTASVNGMPGLRIISTTVPAECIIMEQIEAGTVAAMEELAEHYLDMGERQKSADTYRTIASIHKNFKHTLQHKEFMEKADQVEQGA